MESLNWVEGFDGLPHATAPEGDYVIKRHSGGFALHYPMSPAHRRAEFGTLPSVEEAQRFAEVVHREDWGPKGDQSS